MQKELLEFHAKLAAMFPCDTVSIQIGVANYYFDEPVSFAYTALIAKNFEGDFEAIALAETPEELLTKCHERTIRGATEAKHDHAA